MGENRKKKRNTGGLGRPPSVKFRTSMETASMKMSKSKTKKVVGNQRGSAEATLFVGTSRLPYADFTLTYICIDPNHNYSKSLKINKDTPHRPNKSTRCWSTGR